MTRIPLEKRLVNVDDQQCWAEYRAGSEAAFTELSRRYYRKLVHYGLKFTSDVQVVEDALQDVLVHLWLHRQSVSETPSVKFYLMKAFRHQLFKSLKRLPTLTSEEDRLGSELPEFSAEEVLIQQEETQQQQYKVSQLLASLPPRQREVMYLRYYQDLRVDEIAQLLSIKPQSVSNILQRSLANLRENWHLIILSLFLALAGVC
ncbi:sigma-70 family RNA polymerase sigma factor [Nibrella viscosa]|uniref:Sigma-70 family RNA polymerase sigma factor n=1 Tax=Nibrella viscosa TaxID=1084524 RepID=A0ABP8JQY6_9BACT